MGGVWPVALRMLFIGEPWPPAGCDLILLDEATIGCFLPDGSIQLRPGIDIEPDGSGEEDFYDACCAERDAEPGERGAGGLRVARVTTAETPDSR